MLAIDPQTVRAQTARILASEAFVRSRRMQRFLEFIVEKTLAGREDQLGEYAIGVTVFDRGEDFEPALDPIVRNDARRLRQKLIEYNCNHPRELVIDIPKGGYVPVFRSVPAPVGNQGTRRLAVLPFEDLSPDAEKTFYARSLGIALTARLASLDGVNIVSHNYSSDLTHAIQGSTAISGKRCWTVISLLDIADGTQLWAREFNCAFDVILDLQSEIASSVARDVAVHLEARTSLCHFPSRLSVLTAERAAA